MADFVERTSQVSRTTTASFAVSLAWLALALPCSRRPFCETEDVVRIGIPSESTWGGRGTVVQVTLVLENCLALAHLPSHYRTCDDRRGPVLVMWSDCGRL